jgi:hypothetical protein
MAVDHSATPDQVRAAEKRATAYAAAEAAAAASRAEVQGEGQTRDDVKGRRVAAKDKASD